jgi:hypothetical protein
MTIKICANPSIISPASQTLDIPSELRILLKDTEEWKKERKKTKRWQKQIAFQQKDPNASESRFLYFSSRFRFPSLPLIAKFPSSV